MYRFLHPFLYDELLRQVLTDTGLNRVLIHGGRGLGKTNFLRRAQRELIPGTRLGAEPPAESARATWVDKTTKDAHEKIVAWCEEPRGTLIVDDFSSLFTSKIDDAILGLEDADEAEFRILVGSLKPPRELEADVIEEKRLDGSIKTSAWDDSRAIPTFTSFRLDPWKGAWSKRLETSHDAALERLRKFVKTLAHSAGGGETGQSPPLPHASVVKHWVHIIRETTGGYPILVDGAFDLFTSLVLNELVQGGWIEAQDATIVPQRKRCRWASELTLSAIGLGPDVGNTLPDEVHQEVRALVEDYLQERNMMHLEHTMRALQASDPGAFESLCSLLTSPEGAVVENSRHRLVLLDSGLVRQTESRRKLALPLGLLRNTLRSMAPHDPEEPSDLLGDQPAPPRVEVLGITVVAGDDGKEGVVKLATSEGPRDVELRGRTWEVFDYLRSQQGQPVSAEGLTEPVGFPSVYSAQDAIRRLRLAFRDVGTPQVVENVRGVGYRLGEV